MKEVSIGPLTLIGELAGVHVHVTVLGAGSPGQRPLCGRVTVSSEEWDALAATAEAMVIDGRRQQLNGGELARLDLALAQARAESDVLRQECEQWKRAAAQTNELLETYKERFAEQGATLGTITEQRDEMRKGLARYVSIRNVQRDWDWHAIAREADKMSPLYWAADAIARVIDAEEAAKEKERG